MSTWSQQKEFPIPIGNRSLFNDHSNVMKGLEGGITGNRAHHIEPWDFEARHRCRGDTARGRRRRCDAGGWTESYWPRPAVLDPLNGQTLRLNICFVGVAPTSRFWKQ